MTRPGTPPERGPIANDGVGGRVFAGDRRSVALAAALGSAIVALIGLPLAAWLNIWVDEAFTLHTTGAGPLEAWSQAVAFEVQPPLYFVLVALWRTFNEGSIFFARLPSVALVAAAVALIVVAVHRVAPRVPPLLVALVTAFNPFVIWAAVEMRVYGMVFLIGAALTLLFREAFLVAAPWRMRALYVAVAVAGLYTQYYIGFLLVAQAVALLAIRRRSLPAFIACGSIVAVAFAPFVPVVLMHARVSSLYVLRLSPLHALHSIFNTEFSYVLPHDIGWHGAVKYVGFVLAAGLAALCAYARPVLRESTRGIVVQWLALLAIFSVMLVVSGAPDDIAVHATVLAPASLIAVFVLASSLARLQRTTAVAAVVIYAVFAATTFWGKYHPPLSKHGDWKRVAAAIRAEGPKIPIAVVPAYVGSPLSWYLPNPTIAIPRALPYTSDYVAELTIASEADVARVLDPVRAASQQLWLISTDCEVSPTLSFNFHCAYVDDYVRGHYRVVKTLNFNGSTLELLQTTDGARTSREMRNRAG